MFSLGFYTNERLGEISTIIHKDVDNMEMVVGHLWTRMSADFIVALILGIGLFYVDWRMALTMVAILPIALFSLYRGIRSGMKAQEESQDNLADMVSLFVEYVTEHSFSSKHFQNRNALDVFYKEADHICQIVLRLFLCFHSRANAPIQ